MPRKLTHHAITVIVFLCAAAWQTVHATSCAPMYETYYFKCEAAHCAPLFSEMPIRAPGGMCARRNQLSEIPPAYADYLARVVLTGRPTAETGIYSVKFHFNWWRYEPAPSFEKWSERLAGEARLPLPTAESPTIPVQDLVRWMREYHKETQVKLEISQTDAASVDTLRQRLEEESSRVWRHGAMWISAAWAFGFIAGFALMFSMHLFYRKLGSGSHTIRLTKFEILLSQFVGAGTLLWASSYFNSFDELFYAEPRLVFLIPLVLLVLFVEGFWLILFWFRRSAAS